MRNPRALVLAVLLVVLAVLAITSRPYRAGLAWEWGGIELSPRPGLFICPASRDPLTGERWINPAAPLFPALVVDC